MREILLRILIGVVVSCFFYPFAFKFLPGINTKMILGAIGLVIFALKLNSRNRGEVSIYVIVATCFTLLFSLLCFMPAVIFATGDDSYSTYYISFFVWVFGAYTVCDLIRYKNGVTDLRTITYYLTVVAVAQCILAQLISDFPAFQSMVDSVIEQGQDFMKGINRIYGIGASLDSAGVRFSITLLLIAHMIVENGKEEGHSTELWMLYLSFIFITVFGNMIARTTTVGAVLAISYILVRITVRANANLEKSRLKSFLIVVLILGAAIPVFTYLYATNTEIHSQMRFAFEGFFNWVETGDFTTSSTEKLKANMWIWPKDNLTWLIGTGKFGNWAFGTDIGYCRFILYCGLVGFSVFAGFFIFNGWAFYRKFEDTGWLAIFLIALTFIIWIKVSTDIFQFYALAICADAVVCANRGKDTEKIPEQ